MGKDVKCVKKSYAKRQIQVLCGFLYMLCLCNILGISWGNVGKAEDIKVHRDVAGKETVSGKGVESTNAGVENEAPKIALTFDDGPSGQYTEKLLDGLKERGIKASFFLIGEYAKENPELVERIYKEGHLIGNHTYHHVDLTHLSREEAKKELIETDRVVSNVTGEHVAYMRPPFGAWQQDLEVELEVMPVLWTKDPLDWTTENISEIVNKVVTDIEENDIILMHDCYGSSVEAALKIIDILHKEGYEFVTVDEILLN